MKRILIVAVILVMMVGLSACGGSHQKTGTAVGAGTGAALGALIGNQAGNAALGAVIGAVVGGAAGAHIGNYMDKQAAEMEKDLEGARIERVGEGIIVTFDSGLLFAVNEATLQPAARANLDNLARILAKYDDTDVLVAGHTDATGSNEYNQMLSVRRAETVTETLVGLNIARQRMTIHGYGETQPIASNDTEAGRALNRRVEIAIYANDELKKAAEKKAG
jgi:outer membrane protein OmpA-like peptidoglycan-associated protein